MTETSAAPEKNENIVLNILINVAIPTLILMKLSGEHYLGPMWGVVVALSFPIAYGLYDFYRQKKINFFSALGVVSVFLTGGISLLGLDPKYIAIKEAAIPAILGLATLISTYTRFPLVRVFLYNDKVMQTDRVAQQLEKRDNVAAFNNALVIASYIVAASFFVSSILNYVLAKLIVVSSPGTEAYASELGKMTAWSYVVIVIPSIAVLAFALVYLFRQIKRLTGLNFEDVLKQA